MTRAPVIATARTSPRPASRRAAGGGPVQGLTTLMNDRPWVVASTE
ncbi:hypothetical protein [Pseudarthrobacter siccitolerans]|nr:hypothetical protein [Pseudarthrobacter siccitolerans]